MGLADWEAQLRPHYPERMLGVVASAKETPGDLPLEEYAEEHAIPANPGVNPGLTITALAERPMSGIAPASRQGR